MPKDSNDEATLHSSPTTQQLNLPDGEALARSRGFDLDEWEIVGARVNEWEGPIKGGGIRTFHQLRVQLRKKISLTMLSPAVHVPAVLPNRPRTPRQTGGPQIIVIEGDHQAPYEEPALHEASLRFLQDVQPDGHVFLGDTLDFATISRHKDNPVHNATPMESIQQGYNILRAKREAAPNAWAVKLPGNHDWRLASEQLLRAERTYGIRPADDGTPQEDAFSINRLLHLEALGIKYVEDKRGWEHGEFEITPELVVRHGWLTGHNTGGRTLEKLGRTVIVGHTHGKEHVFKLQYGSGDPKLIQAVVAGTMSRLDFPYAVKPNWHQGYVVATVWPDGKHYIDHAIWDDGALYWRGDRWSA